MTDKEKIKAEIERRRNIVNNAALQMKDVNLYYHYSKIVEEYDDILRFIDSSKEPVSEDLERAINFYIENNFFGSETLGFFSNRTKEEPNDQDIALAFKAGAQWQKEQMMKDAVDGFVEEPVMFQWRIVSNDLEGKFVVKNKLTDGDKVKIIIIKED